MTHQDFQVCTIIVNHSYSVKWNGLSWYLCPSSSDKRIFAYSTFTRTWVQATGLFAQATCAPKFGLPRPFNQRLLILHVFGGAVKRVKFKTNKFQNKNKKKSVQNEKKTFDWLCFQDVHVTSFYHSGKFVFLERSELSRIGCWINGLSYLEKKKGWIKIRRLFPN